MCVTSEIGLLGLPRFECLLATVVVDGELEVTKFSAILGISFISLHLPSLRLDLIYVITRAVVQNSCFQALRVQQQLNLFFLDVELVVHLRD